MEYDGKLSETKILRLCLWSIEIVAFASIVAYFQLIVKFTVHSFIYKDGIFLAYSLLHVPFRVVLICEFPTDSTVVIGETAITNEHTSYTMQIDMHTLTYVCVHACYHEKLSSAILILFFDLPMVPLSVHCSHSHCASSRSMERCIYEQAE